MTRSRWADDRKVYKIEDGETHWVVAETIEGAILLHGVTNLGYPTVKEYRRDMWPIKIAAIMPQEKVKVTDDDGTHEKRACEWALTETGVFCSTTW